MNEQHRCIEYMIDTIVKSVLAEIQEVFCEDKGWDNEENMIVDMAFLEKDVWSYENRTVNR